MSVFTISMRPTFTDIRVHYFKTAHVHGKPYTCTGASVNVSHFKTTSNAHTTVTTKSVPSEKHLFTSYTEHQNQPQPAILGMIKKLTHLRMLSLDHCVFDTFSVPEKKPCHCCAVSFTLTRDSSHFVCVQMYVIDTTRGHHLHNWCSNSVRSSLDLL